MKREEVYELINGERDYQDKKWGGPEHDKRHSLGDFLLYMRYYLSEAEVCYGTDSYEYTADNVRKVAALAVAAMEQFETPPRGGTVFSKQ